MTSKSSFIRKNKSLHIKTVSEIASLPGIERLLSSGRTGVLPSAIAATVGMTVSLINKISPAAAACKGGKLAKCEILASEILAI
jgi:hypothetical protein